MFGRFLTSFPETEDGNSIQGGKIPRPPSSEAADLNQLELSPRPHPEHTPRWLLSQPTQPETGPSNVSWQAPPGNIPVYSQRSDKPEEVLPQERALQRFHSGTPDPSDYRPDSSDSDQPLMRRTRAKKSRTDSDDSIQVIAGGPANQEGIQNAPSGRPYHCYNASSKPGSAIFPDGYQLETMNKFSAQYEWICSVRDCRALFANMHGLNVHFRQLHNHLRLNDNRDGTVSIVGWRDNRSLPGSIVVSQRPAPATLAMPEPRLSNSLMQEYRQQQVYTAKADLARRRGSQDKDKALQLIASDISNGPSQELQLILNALEAAQKSHLWDYVQSFLGQATKARLTFEAKVSDLQALVQILSYPRRRKLKREWVTGIQNQKKRRVLMVITLVYHAVGDTILGCDACSSKPGRTGYCSSLQNIRPEHVSLKQLVDGKCCYCTLSEAECRVRVDPTGNTLNTAPRNAKEGLRPENRQQCRAELGLLLTKAIETHKIRFLPGLSDAAEYVRQCAEHIELDIFMSEDPQGYIIKANSFCNKLRDHRAKNLLLDILGDQISPQSPATIVAAAPLPPQDASTPRLMNGSSSRAQHHSASLLKRRRQSSLLAGERSARDVSEMGTTGSPSTFSSRLDATSRFTSREVSPAKSGPDETFGSVMLRATNLGNAYKRLDQQAQVAMLQWARAIFSAPRLDATQKILELVAVIQKAPLEMRDELRHAHTGVLQVVLPEAAPGEWMAAILATPGVSSELERDVLTLVTAVRKMPSKEQDSLGPQILSVLDAFLRGNN